MNVSPVSFLGSNSKYQTLISRQYPGYKPNMKDDEVVAWVSDEPGYSYPITAKFVRDEIKNLKEIEKEIKEIKKAQKKQKPEASRVDKELQPHYWGEGYVYYA